MKLSSMTPLSTQSAAQAALWLKQGQLLAYPTESVWGIGCDPFNQHAVQQLLTLKQRPINKGMIVITDSFIRILPLLQGLNPALQQTILNSWTHKPDTPHQQADTWLLPLNKSLSVPIPAWITGEHTSVAVRVIAHPLIQQLCAQMACAQNPYGFIVSTSCNPSGQPPALSLAQAQDYFAMHPVTKQVHYFQGDTLHYQQPSQINDALTGQIIR